LVQGYEKLDQIGRPTVELREMVKDSQVEEG
jgi:hypothetical protein